MPEPTSKPGWLDQPVTARFQVLAAAIGLAAMIGIALMPWWARILAILGLFVVARAIRRR